jgi:alpha-amylase/alpha-mannosidase (GH57 family)
MSAHRVLACIHGHFYQPPRENPWLEELEREPSAAPHHNWNARITEECYAPNAWARVLDDDGRVRQLYDNYARLSFNIGPTLVSWLQRHAPETLDAIVSADMAAVARTGQGNALAQVYNHVILPLANERDKRTQVRWGIAAFSRTFGRLPRGMWLAETAVDAETLEVLADEGIEFTILSPFQAARFRVDGTEAFVDCADGTIPTGRAYRYTCSSGKVVHIFFYDGAIARGVAFEGLLTDANNLVGAIHRAHEQRQAPVDEPWLVHTATDGESYGHHFRFGDMALAAAHARLDADDRVEIVNYATFLDRYGARGDVELHPVSAWSCSHGVGRWERDCGCRIGHHPPTSQAWRTPLRQALNTLRDDLAAVFERAAVGVLDDPWAARNAYIDVVVDRTHADAFLARHGVAGASRSTALQLLEMQRCALLMFTSCGWFFDDIAGPEPVILLRYAARALSLLRSIDVDAAHDAEARFTTILAEAKSNHRTADGRERTGKDIYVEDAVSAVMGADRVAVTLALGAGLGETPPQRLAAWRVSEHEERSVDDASVPTVVGRLVLVDERTTDADAFAFVVVGFGGLEWRGVLVQADAFEHVWQQVSSTTDASALSRALDALVADGARAFSLKDAAADVRASIVQRALARRVDVTDAVVAELMLSERALLRGAVALGGALSPTVRGLVKHALERRARDIVDELVKDVGSAASATRRLKTVLDDARGFGVELDLDLVVRGIEAGIVDDMARAIGHHTDSATRAVAVADAVRLLTVLPVLSLPSSKHAPLPPQNSWRLLQSGSMLLTLATRATASAAVVDVARAVLPALDAVCRSSFASQLSSTERTA